METIIILSLISCVLFLIILLTDLIDSNKLLYIFSIILLLITYFNDTTSLDKLVYSSINLVIVLLFTLCILSELFDNSILLNKLTDKLSSITSFYNFSILIIIGSCVFSSFINNTIVVNIVVSIVQKICKNNNWNFNSLLMPISFSSMLGGTLTLIGSSTNMVAASIVKPNINLEIFDLLILSLPTAILGCIYLLYISFLSSCSENSGCCVQGKNQLNINIKFFKVCHGSCVIDMNVKNSGIQEFQGMQLCGIQRYKNFISAIPRSYTTIKENDILLMIGTSYKENTSELITKKIINICEKDIDSDFYNIQELSSGKIGDYFSKLINNNCAQLKFKEEFKLILLGVMRDGDIITENIGKLKLKYKDYLIVSGDNSTKQLSKTCRYTCKLTKDKIDRKEINDSITDIFLYTSFLVIIISGFVIKENNNNVNSIVLLLGLYICKVITDDTLCNGFLKYKNILFSTTASLLLSTCLEINGITKLISKIILYFTRFPDIYLYFLIHFFTSISSLLLSNIAVVSVLIPAAKIVCLDNLQMYKVMVFCIIHGASCCFASPTGYHTNLIINSIAGYQCKDFIKIGLPLQIITSISFSISIYYLI